MVRVPWMLSIDPEVKEAVSRYLDAQEAETKRYSTASAFVQELVMAKLKREGFWPPKRAK